MELLSYTFVPSMIGLGFIYFLDKNREPLSTISIVLFAGFLLCLPAGLLNTYVPPLIGLSDEDAFIAGFTEEPLKFLAFLMFVKSRKEFDEPMDAVVYGAMLSIGFATFENFEYVYVYDFEVDPLTVAMLAPLQYLFTLLRNYNGCFIALGYHKPSVFYYLRLQCSCFLTLHIILSTKLLNIHLHTFYCRFDHFVPQKGSKNQIKIT